MCVVGEIWSSRMGPLYCHSFYYQLHIEQRLRSSTVCDHQLYLATHTAQQKLQPAVEEAVGGLSNFGQS